MAFIEYHKTGPIDCPAELNYAKVTGRTVIVTGGSNGLGEAYVTALADSGAFVVNGDLNPPAKPYKTSNILFVKCDVSSWEDQAALFAMAKAKSPNGGIDIVIANAGVFREDRFFEVKINLKMLEVHVHGAYFTAKLAAHYFSRQPKANDRCLILVGSVMSYLDTYGAVGYGLAKHAIRGMFGVLRRRGIMRVNMLAPWYTRTTVLSPEVNKTLDGLFASQGLSFALVEDAVRAMMRIATDPSLNGHALSNVPRVVASSGYVDVNSDDFVDGSLLDRFQKSVAEIKYPNLIAPVSKL
ncbi:hypothetical protein AYO21_06481 [Fonsecaea monophora]|uniref:Uncharacterized protein n=1 Tax=Fonsecaea monophora TaxID=254056 RepID=A0A177F4T9_9EURO|nr:hypothetical protein AYO21_06481 [Fonsecaea monophora]OAG39277.1 hypothetical protein AYO21_06481 [Fonsecaea monophora]